MTVHTTRSADIAVDDGRRSDRMGGIAALVQATTFVVGIAMFATLLTDYTDTDATPAESVSFLVDHQGALLVWNLVTLVVFAVALVPLTLSLHRRLSDRAPSLSAAAAGFGLIWSGLIFATGMISNIGLRVVGDLAPTDPEQAEAVWSSLDAVTNGLGGGNELVGAIWVLLVSVAALRTDRLPRALNLAGILSAGAGLATVVPGTEAAEIVFGLGMIVWFAWLGVVLIRDRHDRRDRPIVR
jgi:hypothetical protein